MSYASWVRVARSAVLALTVITACSQEKTPSEDASVGRPGEGRRTPQAAARPVVSRPVTKGSEAGKARTFGASVTLAEATPIDRLIANAESYAGKLVRIEGTVASVCKMSGCWVEVRDATGHKMMAQSLDESVLVPMDCDSLPIVVEGHVTKSGERYVLAMEAVELTR
jgi:hypothetical protein